MIMFLTWLETVPRMALPLLLRSSETILRRPPTTETSTGIFERSRSHEPRGPFILRRPPSSVAVTPSGSSTSA
jgi:hypothetical protein